MAEFKDVLCTGCSFLGEWPDSPGSPKRFFWRTRSALCPVCTGRAKYLLKKHTHSVVRTWCMENEEYAIPTSILYPQVSMLWGRTVHPNDLGLVIKPARTRGMRIGGVVSRGLRLIELQNALDSMNKEV